MAACRGTYGASPHISTATRPCGRPAEHDGEHGPIVVNRTRYKAPVPVEEFLGEAGWELNGALLPDFALDALAKSRTYHAPCEYVVVGEINREDGARFLQFGVPTAYIESVSNYRAEPDGRLRLVCPECAYKDGNHSRSCERR